MLRARFLHERKTEDLIIPKWIKKGENFPEKCFVFVPKTSFKAQICLGLLQSCGISYENENENMSKSKDDLCLLKNIFKLIDAQKWVRKN